MINATTKLIGLLGDPVSHSLSPTMQNAALNAMGLNWCYLALPCKKDTLPSVLDGLLNTGFQGLNITIPFKNEVAKYCTELSPLAKRLGAVNTILPSKKGGWYGTNTDVEGFLAPLKNKQKKDHKAALILGYGGSARAVVAGLLELNFKEIIIVGRRQEAINEFIKNLNKAKIISSKIKLKGISDSNKKVMDYIHNSELIVNATPIGMHSDTDKDSSKHLPLKREIWMNLQSKTILYDLIYTPRPTTWLKYGKEKGCKTIDGLDMLVHQGAASLRLWSGVKEVPTSVMKEAAENALNI